MIEKNIDTILPQYSKKTMVTKHQTWFGVSLLLCLNARRGTRTLNPLQAQDFKSCAYTNSAIRAYFTLHFTDFSGSLQPLIQTSAPIHQTFLHHLSQTFLYLYGRLVLSVLPTTPLELWCKINPRN